MIYAKAGVNVLLVAMKNFEATEIWNEKIHKDQSCK
jgi:hypothetical protein